MKKRTLWRSILVLVLCCSLVLNVFAATTTETIENEDGTATVIITDETVTTVDGETTVVTNVQSTTTGTTTDGVTVNGSETYNQTTTTDENGEVISDSWNEQGSETKEWNVEDTGDGDQTPVDVTLTPGETTTGTVTSTTTTDNVTGDADDVITDTTTTTTTDRTATAITSDVEVKVNDAETGLVDEEASDLQGLAPVYDETDDEVRGSNGKVLDAHGKDGLFDRNHLSSQTWDKLVMGDIVIWINDSSKTISNIYIPEGAEVPEDFNYTVGMNVSGWFSGSNLHKNKVPAGSTFANNVQMADINTWYEDGELIMNVPEGGDFMYVGTGEHSKYWVAYVVVTYQKALDENGDPIYDENGEPVYACDENGDPIIESIKTSNGTQVNVDGEPATMLVEGDFMSGYTGSRACNFMLMDASGNKVFGYCCDIETGTNKSSWYSFSNLEDSDYYASEESADHIRSIVMNGYWGTSDIAKEDGSYELGSVEYIKANLLAAIASGELPAEYETYLYSECTCDGACSSSNPCTGGKLQRDENGDPIVVKYNMLDLINSLTEGEALLATQAAIWSYANGHQNAMSGKDGAVVVDAGSRSNFNGTKNEHEPLDNEANARVEFLYNWLINLDTEEESTIVINDTNFVEDLSLTVGDKAEGYEVNTDDNADNDVYDTALNFKLAFIPGADDDLLVHISYTDLDGRQVNIVRRLAGSNDEGENYIDILPEADGTYILSGLKLSENKDFSFDLRLEGTQYLENGVYVYAPVGGRDVSQTFVGIAEGERNVDVTLGVTVSFDVDENDKVVAERVWSAADDPVTPELPGGDNYNDLPDGGNVWPDAPNGNIQPDGAEDLEEIEEEEVPLADVPNTGDASMMFTILAILSACGLAVLAVTKKREQN